MSAGGAKGGGGWGVGKTGYGRDWNVSKIRNGLVDVNFPAGTLEHTNRSSREHKDSSTDLHTYFPLAVRLGNSVSTGAPSVVTLPVFRSALRDWMEEQTCP